MGRLKPIGSRMSSGISAPMAEPTSRWRKRVRLSFHSQRKAACPARLIPIMYPNQTISRRNSQPRAMGKAEGAGKSTLIGLIARLHEPPDEEKIEELRQEVETHYSFSNIIGSSSEMQKIYQVLRKVLNNDSTILVTGESGTGKELVARAIHSNSARADRSFVTVN